MSRMNENDAWRARTASRLDTLATDLAALAARLNGTASLKFTLKIANDVARVKEKLNLPDTYTSWGADHFLTEDESDMTHVDMLAKIEEGVRFPDAAMRDSQIGLLNPLDPTVFNQANFVLPAYDEVARLEVLGHRLRTFDLAVSVSNDQLGIVHQDPHPHPLGNAVCCLLQRRLVVCASRS